MKKLFLLFSILFAFANVKAQTNPFEELGYTPRFATLSNGQFNEFHDNDTIVQIGSVLLNTKSKQIIGFVEYDTLYSKATMQPDIVSRWISPDPLADHPYQIDKSPYQFGWNNPIRWNDPDGRCPFCPWLDAIVDIGFVAYDIGVLVHEKVTTGETSATNWAALGADAASIVVPMSVGAGMAVRAGAKAINKVDNAVDVAKAVDKAGDASKAANKSDGARFIGDTDGKLIDTKTTPKGSYNQPDGSRTDVLQQKSHYDKNTKQNHGTSHTHETYTNVDKQGSVRTGVDSKKTHKPTYDEVKNIETGKAKKQ